MNSLATLIKLQKTFVDEQQQVLRALLELLDQIDAKATQLEIRKACELESARELHATASYGTFLKGVVLQERELEKERRSTMIAVELAQNKLALLFEEQKRYEIAEASRIEAEQRVQRRRETLELDEIGSVIHERKRDDR